MIEISKIKIDELTQSRVELNQDVVDEYAQAMLEGAEFPAITVFFDGSVYWLADGYHRYFAAKKAGKTLILESIVPGTKRDAILYSVGANTTHGIRRTNADKRKAVVTLLDDPEWSNWSDSQIAKACSVSHPFVGKLRGVTLNITSDDTKTTERIYTTKHGTQATMQVSNIGKNTTALPQVDEPKTEVEFPPEYVGADEDEISNLMQDMQEELEILRKIVESDDQLKAAHEEIKRLKAVEKGLQSRFNGVMEEKAAAIQQAKKYQRQVEKLKKELGHV